MESPSSSQLVQDFATIHRNQDLPMVITTMGGLWLCLEKISIVPVGSTFYQHLHIHLPHVQPTVERIDERIDRRPSCILVELW